MKKRWILMVSGLVMAGVMALGEMPVMAESTENEISAPVYATQEILVADGNSGVQEKEEAEYVTFGEYPKGKPIEWIVLDEQNGKKLLLSRYNLDFMAYNHKDKSVTWQTSDLRKWMNSYFYLFAFSFKEKAYIKKAALKNEDSPSGTDGGKDTKDWVFALSLNEIYEYFGMRDPQTGEIMTDPDTGKPVIDSDALKTVCIDEKRPQYMYEGDTVPSAVEDPDFFFTRTPGSYSRSVSIVLPAGGVAGGEAVFREHGVRPAIWVSD
nr:DUF6273 domain-containing protein [Lachnospiraceae bacterium]